MERPSLKDVQRYCSFRAMADPDSQASPNERAQAERACATLKARYPDIEAVVEAVLRALEAPGGAPSGGVSPDAQAFFRRATDPSLAWWERALAAFVGGAAVAPEVAAQWQQSVEALQQWTGEERPVAPGTFSIRLQEREEEVRVTIRLHPGDRRKSPRVAHMLSRLRARIMEE